MDPSKRAELELRLCTRPDPTQNENRKDTLKGPKLTQKNNCVVVQ